MSPIKILVIIGIWILIAGMNLLLINVVVESFDKMERGYSLYETVGTSIMATGLTMTIKSKD